MQNTNAALSSKPLGADRAAIARTTVLSVISAITRNQGDTKITVTGETPVIHIRLTEQELATLAFKVARGREGQESDPAWVNLDNHYDEGFAVASLPLGKLGAEAGQWGVIGSVEQSGSGNTILRCGTVTGGGSAPVSSWTQTHHVVLTPQEREELLSILCP